MIAAMLVLDMMWPRAARAVELFAGDKRLECEYRTLMWKRRPVLGEFQPLRSVPCSATPWTEEGERLWGAHRAALERSDRCTGERWHRRLALGGGVGLLGVIGAYTAAQIGHKHMAGSTLASIGLAGAVFGGVLALLTEGRCPAMLVPEWAR